MAVLTVTALYVLIFFWAAWGYRRRRDPLLRDVMWVFAAEAMLFLLGIFKLVVGAPPRTLVALVSTLLLAQPMLTLRLVRQLRPVPEWLMIAAVVAWVASAAP